MAQVTQKLIGKIGMALGIVVIVGSLVGGVVLAADLGRVDDQTDSGVPVSNESAVTPSGTGNAERQRSHGTAERCRFRRADASASECRWWVTNEFVSAGAGNNARAAAHPRPVGMATESRRTASKNAMTTTEKESASSILR